MAYDKVVDSSVLDAGLKQVADAIREKGGTSDNLVFPTGMAAAVSAIQAGGGGGGGGNNLNATVLERGSFTPAVTERRIELTLPPEANVLWIQMDSYTIRGTFDVTKLPARGFIGAWVDRTADKWNLTYAASYNSAAVNFSPQAWSILGNSDWTEDGSFKWYSMQNSGASTNVVAGETYNWVAMII